ncbi:O-antigen ligase family protein [Aquimarina pacifica]|uniref:O-antigen ligase family protein n=1 Tax=Aquimarina pacifica TaxID=1296415 RepID=UPI0004704419|nr:O-antigen ligase family protein [Aquimarina pacifica]
MNMFYKEDHWTTMIFWNSLFVAFFLLPLGINLPTPFFMLSIVFGVAMIFKTKRKFVLDKSVLLFPLYFIVMLFGLIYTENLSSGLELVQRSLTLLLFPIIFLFVKEDAATVRRLFDFLLLGLLVSFFINIIRTGCDLIWHLNDINKSNEAFSFIEGIYREWHHFFIGDSFSKSVNSNYISIYILLVLSYYLKNKIESRLRFVVIVILFFYLFLLASVSAYLILWIMSLVLIFEIVDKEKKYIMLIVFVLGTILFLNNPKLTDIYSRIKYYNKIEGYEVNTSAKSKILAWDASIKLIKDAPILGYGVGDANDVLISKYKELEYRLNYQNRYNSHNQFLQTYLQTGIIGFGVLVSIFVVLAIRMKRSRNEFSVFLILLISLLFESMLVRFSGIVFFSIVIPLLLKKRSILSSRIIRNNLNK